MTKEIIVKLVRWRAGQPSDEEFTLEQEYELAEKIAEAAATVINGGVIASDPDWALVATPTPPGVQVHITFERGEQQEALTKVVEKIGIEQATEILEGWYSVAANE